MDLSSVWSRAHASCDSETHPFKTTSNVCSHIGILFSDLLACELGASSDNSSESSSPRGMSTKQSVTISGVSFAKETTDSIHVDYHSITVVVLVGSSSGTKVFLS